MWCSSFFTWFHNPVHIHEVTFLSSPDFECISHFPPHFLYRESSDTSQTPHTGEGFCPFPRNAHRKGSAPSAHPGCRRAQQTPWFGILPIASSGRYWDYRASKTNHMTTLSPGLRQRQPSVPLHSLISRKNCVKITINTVLTIFI